MGKSDWIAFISYRQVPHDSLVADSVQRAIEGYRVPKPLQKPGTPARLGRVYLDVTEGSAGTPLSKEIQTALRASRFLIVLCSPEAKKSPWVNDEIAFFKALGRADNVLPVLVAGEPPEAFPDALTTDHPHPKESAAGTENLVVSARQPVAVDLRTKGRLSRWLRLRHEKLRLIAPMLGIRYDDLKGRQQERERQQRRLALSLVGATVALIVVSLGYAYQQHRVAEDRLNRALDTTNKIVFDMALTPANAATRMKLLEDADALVRELEPNAPNDERLHYIKAAVWGVQGDIDLLQGKRDAAADKYMLAVELSRKLANARPNDDHLELLVGGALQRYGDVLVDKGQRAEARRYYDESQKVALGGLARDAATVAFHELLAAAHVKLGDLSFAEADFDAADKSYRQGLAEVTLVYDDKPTQPERMEALATVLDKLGILLLQQRKFEAARPLIERDLAVRRQLLEAEPESPLVRRDLGVSLERAADIALETGDLKQAEALLSESLRLRKELQALDRTNSQYRRDLAATYERLSRIAIDRGDLESAASMLSSECSLLRRPKGEPEDARSLADISACVDRHGDVLMQQGTVDQALAAYGALLQYTNALMATQATPGPEERRSLAVAHEKVGVAAMWLGRSDEALAHLETNLRLRRELANDGQQDRFALDLTVAEWNLGELERRRKRFKEAEALEKAALARAESLMNFIPELSIRLQAAATLTLSEIALDQGTISEAQRLADAALLLFRRLAPEGTATIQSMADLGTAAASACKAHRAAKALNAAEEACRLAVASLEAAAKSAAYPIPENDRNLLDAEVALVLVLQDKHHLADARNTLTRAEEMAENFAKRKLYRGEVVVAALETRIDELRRALREPPHPHGKP